MSSLLPLPPLVERGEGGSLEMAKWRISKLDIYSQRRHNKKYNETYKDE
jgi:hypothetical protein